MNLRIGKQFHSYYSYIVINSLHNGYECENNMLSGLEGHGVNCDFTKYDVACLNGYVETCKYNLTDKYIFSKAISVFVET